MAKRKMTTTLDSAKAERARHLSGATTTSGVIDLALDTLIRRKLIDNDIAAYRQSPTTSEERLLSSTSNLDNLQLVARTRLVRRVGRATPQTMDERCRALTNATGCG